MNENTFFLAQSSCINEFGVGTFFLLMCCCLLVFGTILFFWGVSIYNGLITLRNRVKNTFAQIDVQLKRRYDLIPNLVETVKGYMTHEKGTLEAVVQARSVAVSANQDVAIDTSNPETMRKLTSAESHLSSALSRLLVVCESYPELKANQNVMLLQEELTTTENKISFTRQAYNDAVMDYNTAREKFPACVLAGFTGFLPSSPFEIENPAEKETPKVQF